MTDTENLVVIQDDRDRAADYAKTRYVASFIVRYRNGSLDSGPLVQAFARHRIDAITAAQQEIARLREALGQALCCTPHIRAGEIVYDCGDPYDIARKALEPSGETR